MRDVIVVGGRMVVRQPFQWGAVWYGKVRDLRTGRVWKVGTYKKDRHKALSFLVAWAEDKKKELEAQFDGSRRRTFGEAFEEWLGTRELRASTEGDYRRCLRGVYEPCLGNLEVDSITMADIERLLKRPYRKGKTEKKRGLRTKRKHVTLLRAFFRWAVHQRYCSRDPTDGIRLPRPPRFVQQALNIEEARRLVQKCGDDIMLHVQTTNRGEFDQKKKPPKYLQIAVLIALHTGLRKGNILGLKWRHVDISKGIIKIPAEEMKANVEHSVPLHPELLESLKKLLAGRDSIDPDGPVIGERLLEIKRSFKSALPRAELPTSFRFHDLRHTFATWVESRASYAQLQSLLGHSPSSVTLKYTHPSLEELRGVVERMPRLLCERLDQLAEGMD